MNRQQLRRCHAGEVAGVPEDRQCHVAVQQVPDVVEDIHRTTEDQWAVAVDDTLNLNHEVHVDAIDLLSLERIIEGDNSA